MSSSLQIIRQQELERAREATQGLGIEVASIDPTTLELIFDSKSSPLIGPAGHCYLFRLEVVGGIITVNDTVDTVVLSSTGEPYQDSPTQESFVVLAHRAYLIVPQSDNATLRLVSAKPNNWCAFWLTMAEDSLWF